MLLLQSLQKFYLQKHYRKRFLLNFVLLVRITGSGQVRSVGILTSYGKDGRGFNPSRDKIFSLFYYVQNVSGAHPFFYPIGNGALSSGIKQPVREAYDWLPSREEVKNVRNISQFPMCLHDVVLN
jgi:hypothetical protein